MISYTFLHYDLGEEPWSCSPQSFQQLVLNLTYSGHFTNACPMSEQGARWHQADLPVRSDSQARWRLSSRSVGRWAGSEICREVKFSQCSSSSLSHVAEGKQSELSSHEPAP